MKIEYKGSTIELKHDETPSNPRKEYEHMGTMICAHRRYDLGDRGPEDWDGNILNDNDYIALPLYLYDHSGVTISTTPFSCRWDSGMVGVIFMSREDVRREFATKRISPRLKAHVEDILRAEVKEYDYYLRGDVWGYRVIEAGEEVDSCWGFYGKEDALTRAKDYIDYSPVKA